MEYYIAHFMDGMYYFIICGDIIPSIVDVEEYFIEIYHYYIICWHCIPPSMEREPIFSYYSITWGRNHLYLFMVFLFIHGINS